MQNMKKDIAALDILEKMILTGIYRNFHSQKAKYTFFHVCMEHFHR